ncbi:MAG: DUF393 domain-containing protein [Phycisphaeraceae bacterium]|nr:DUF393 domain-containing protein [Phycisphaerae bacterium]MBX3391117.1 DUF393 domain-containing protein [Phycisphaeraceae bacterium]HRJ49838.1 DUF393 domain-containing protein [Phycisphaerales bacterium]
MTTVPVPTPAFTILIDGQCVLCAREAAFLRRLDSGRGRLAIVDITADGFDPAPFGRPFADLMGRIHGHAPDGRVISGVEVFRRAYAAVGKGYLVAWTGWPLVRWVVDRLYGWFARHRRGISSFAGRLLGRPRPLNCPGDRCRIE